MKKYLIAFCAGLYVLLLNGCDLNRMQQEQQRMQQEQQRMQQEQQRMQQEHKEQKLNDSVYIYTDHETGVQYLCFYYQQGYAGMGGITPRLNSDGSLMVSDNIEENTNE